MKKGGAYLAALLFAAATAAKIFCPAALDAYREKAVLALVSDTDCAGFFQSLGMDITRREQETVAAFRLGLDRIGGAYE